MQGERRDQHRGFELRPADIQRILALGLILPSYFDPTVYGVVGNISTIDPDDAASAGVLTPLARADHQHPITAATASALTETTTSTEGSASTFARSDHGHATSALPWGFLTRFSSTSANGPHTASTDTDMAINNLSVIQGHEYGFHLHAQAATSAAGSLWALEFAVNGTIVDRFGLVQNPPAVHYIDGWCFWTAPTTQATDDFLVKAVELNGAGDLTLQAGGTQLRRLSAFDCG